VCLWKPERIGWDCDFVKRPRRKYFNYFSRINHNKQLRRVGEAATDGRCLNSSPHPSMGATRIVHRAVQREFDC
jgi:hypothetical protein